MNDLTEKQISLLRRIESLNGFWCMWRGPGYPVTNGDEADQAFADLRKLERLGLVLMEGPLGTQYHSITPAGLEALSGPKEPAP